MKCLLSVACSACCRTKPAPRCCVVKSQGPLQPCAFSSSAHSLFTSPSADVVGGVGAARWLVGGRPEDPVGLSLVVPGAPGLSGRHCTSWYGFTWRSCCVNYVANCIPFRLKKLACGTPVKRVLLRVLRSQGGSRCSTD